MADLEVKTQLLRNTATSLRQLRTELDGLDRRRDRLRDAWGSDDVAGALDDFVGNWDDNRRRIQASMEALYNMATATADEFEGIEAALSASFDQ